MKMVLKHMTEVSEAMTLLDPFEVQKLIDLLRVVKAKEGTVYLFGNGGSHATASHFANDLSKIGKVRALCIGDMTPVVTAFGNDTGWENMFYGPLVDMVKWNDGLVGISCSGNSQNVITALRAGRSKWNVLCAGLTGQSDNSHINKVGLDALVHVRAEDIRVQEDVHLMVCHAVVRAMREAG